LCGSRYSTGPTKPVSIVAAVTVASQYSYHPRVTMQLLLRALSVLVNSLYSNGESCRGVALECDATAMLVSVLQQTDNEECLAMAARYNTLHNNLVRYVYTIMQSMTTIALNLYLHYTFVLLLLCTHVSVRLLTQQECWKLIIQ
jgi:hypothetical protein